MTLDSDDDAIEELKLFKQAGGGTVCDLTVRGIRQDRISCLKPVAESAGVHIIFGAGFYEDKFLTDEDMNLSADDLKQTVVDEIVTGIPGSNGVRCGIIGEIGCSWPLTIQERRRLQTAALAQQETG